MIYTLGEPPDHLLNNGLHTSRYFTYTETKTWTIKVKPKDPSLTHLDFIIMIKAITLHIYTQTSLPIRTLSIINPTMDFPFKLWISLKM